MDRAFARFHPPLSGSARASFPSLISLNSIAFCALTMLRTIFSRTGGVDKKLWLVFLGCALMSLAGCSSLPDVGDYTDSLKAIPELGRQSLNSVTKSSPELGMLTDQGTSGRAIVVRLSDQKAFLYRGGEVVAISPASTRPRRV